MKKKLPPHIGLLSILMLANWSAEQEESPVKGRDKKQQVNFRGKLITHEGKKYNVDNISINRAVKQIKMYEVPSQQSYTKDVTNPKNYILTINPKDTLVTTRIDLAEVGELRIPFPDIRWSYQKKKKGRIVKYIEIEVISNDPQKTKNNYLIETKKSMQCDAINEAGPTEMDVPLSAVKSLTIEGYAYRDRQKSKDFSVKKPVQKLSCLSCSQK